MEITVLGKSPAMPDANGANSGYLIRHAGFTLLLDCGSGVFAKLRTVIEPDEVDAVLISHLHADHTLDLLPFSFGLTHFGGGEGWRPQLWAPPGARAAFSAFGTALGMGEQIAEGFTLAEYDPARGLELGPFDVTFGEVPHYIRAWGCDVRSQDGRRLTYGADCGPNDAIVELGRGSDVLMLEATEGAEPHIGGGFRGHLTAGEAGELAQRAGAGRLLLTHYSDRLDADALRAAAAERFRGPVELAVQGAVHLI